MLGLAGLTCDKQCCPCLYFHQTPKHNIKTSENNWHYVVILSIYTFSIFIYIIPNRAYHVTEFRMYLIIIKSELIRCSFLAVSKRSKDTSNDPMGVVLPLVSSALELCNSESSLHRRCIEACTW